MLTQMPRIPFTDNKAVQELQQFLSKFVQDLIADGIVNGRDVDLTFSGAGTQVVTHNLGRPIKGAVVIANSTGASIATDAASGSSTNLTVTAGAAATVRLRLF